jgi:hypothetical protein
LNKEEKLQIFSLVLPCVPVSNQELKTSDQHQQLAVIRYVNGDLILVNPWGIHVLGLGYRENFNPYGYRFGRNSSPIRYDGYLYGEAEFEPDYSCVIFT